MATSTYDRFQEAPEHRGARCGSCDLPLTDENPAADVTAYERVPHLHGVAWKKTVTQGCRHEARLQALRNAVAFLQADIRTLEEGDESNTHEPEDAILEICEAFGWQYLPSVVTA